MLCKVLWINPSEGSVRDILVFMKNTYKGGSFLCLVAIIAMLLTPFITYASHNSDNDDDFDFRSFRRGSQYSSKISDLDDDPVEEIAIPILFGVTLRMIYPSFGDDRDGGDRTHEGLDIMAPKGAPIVSPTEAVVIRTGEGDSSGLSVTTANPGSETFIYMHLSEVLVDEGDELKEGDLIGYVGNTGNASGGAPHLHFEIRDEDRDPTDPYPRLKREFTLKEKISFLEDAIEDSDDEDDFVEFLLETYQSELRQAKILGLELPDDIDKEIIIAPAAAPSSGVSYATASGDLSLNSRGPLVVTLQQALIAKNLGPAAQALKTAGATGYFGAITQKAVIEYQTINGITPAAGYYGPKTRAHMLAN